jgi:PAS domain S-box-containing protein
MTVEFLTSIIEHVAHPVFVKDRSFRFVLVNRALGDMVGYAPEGMIGKTDFDFFPRAEAEFFREKDIELFTNGETVEVEEPITDASGRVHWLSTTKVPHRDASGEVTHVVGIIKDITELKRTGETLRSVNGELERRVAERTSELEAAQRELLHKERLVVLGQLAGGVAHRLRNPLAAIQNAATLLSKYSIPASDAELLAIIGEEVERMNRAITDLLEYARIRESPRQQVALKQIADEVLERERIAASVEVQVEGDDGLMVVTDAVQIQSALNSVVRNALEAMPRGGRLTLRLDSDPGHAYLSVIDTGEGVPPKARPHLFEPLVTTKPLGLGLGLSIAKSLLENQGGTIRYQPEPEGGSRFTLVLPRPAPGP